MKITDEQLHEVADYLAGLRQVSQELADGEIQRIDFEIRVNNLELAADDIFKGILMAHGSKLKPSSFE